MALTLRMENNPEINRKFQKIHKQLGANCATKTIYALIAHYEPSMKRISELEQHNENLTRQLEEYRNNLQVLQQFRDILNRQPKTGNNEAKKD